MEQLFFRLDETSGRENNTQVTHHTTNEEVTQNARNVGVPGDRNGSRADLCLAASPYPGTALSCPVCWG